VIRHPSGSAAGIEIRPATEDDLADCGRLWREAIDAYLAPMGFPPLPMDNPGLRRLHAHTLATDPSRFLIAERGDGRADGPPDPRRSIAFGSAVERGNLWFLSMLFVDPKEQARGLGRALLDELLPEQRDGRLLATCTDSAQPISNGLYASLGMVPRMPLYNYLGRPRPDFEWPGLPAGIEAHRIEDGRRFAESAELAALDRSVLGFVHPDDHRFVQDEPRTGFAYRFGDGTLAGYGYAGEVGRVGPIAVSRADLLSPVLGHLLTAVQPRGASSVWIPGAAGEAVSTALRAGLRIEAFPILACWSGPYADFTRYVPTSPGLI
jgi:GNAT superfamily N-acetyltransferase